MSKIQQTIYITATKVDIDNNKIIAVDGEFYFQGKKYEIKNKIISLAIETKNKEDIPF